MTLTIKDELNISNDVIENLKEKIIDYVKQKKELKKKIKELKKEIENGISKRKTKNF